MINLRYGVADRKASTPATPRRSTRSPRSASSSSRPESCCSCRKTALTIPSRTGCNQQAAWTRITIRHLLTHTAGLVRRRAFDPFRADSDADLIKSAYATPLVFTPERVAILNLAAWCARVITGCPADHKPVHQRTGAACIQRATRTNDQSIINKVMQQNKLMSAPDSASHSSRRSFLSTVLDHLPGHKRHTANRSSARGRALNA